MRKNKIKVYFLGSGAFAVPFLDALNKAENIELVGVGTQPDKPSGRKRLPKPTPLGGFADAVGIPCRRVESVSSDEFMQLMNELVPDLVVVVSFGQLLREKLLNFPRLGCLNVHGSILPKYRGASPLATSILSGDKVNGISFMRMDKGLDTGPVYSVVTMDVPPSMNTQTLEIALSELGSRNIAGIIDRIAEGLQPVPQNEPDATLTRKIRKSDGSVHWDEPAELLERKVRAYYPWPASTFRINGKNGLMSVKITEARVLPESGSPGTALACDKKWIVACGQGALELVRVIPEGSREMNAADFLRGFNNPEAVRQVFDGPPPPEPKNTPLEKKNNS